MSMSVDDDHRIGRLAQDYADAKRESQRIWEWLQSELRAGRSAAYLADLDGLWAAMRRLEQAGEAFHEGAARTPPARDRRRVG
jgi:transposase